LCPQIVWRFAPDYFYTLHSAPADMLLFKAVLNPAAQLASGIVLPAGNRAKLHAQRYAAGTKRFDTQNARPVNENGRP
jgi:hypothetical protein